MYLRNNLFTLIAVLVIATTGFGGTASAFDAGEFLKQLEESATENGNEFSYQSLEDAADGGFTLNSVKVVDQSEDFTITIETLTFTNPQETGTDGLRFDRLQATNFLQVGENPGGEEYSLTAANFNAENFALPNLGDQENPLWPADIELLELSDVTLTTENGEQEVKIQSPGLTLVGLVANEGTNFSLQSLIIEPASGSVKPDASDEALDIGFDGLVVREAEHFGVTGFEAAEIDLGAMVFQGQDEEGRNINFVFNGMSAQNLYVADPSVLDRPMVSEKPMDVSFGELKLSLDGQEVAGWMSGNGSTTYDAAKHTTKTDAQISDIFLNFDAIPMEPHERKNLEQLKALGYEEISMNVELAVLWDLAAGIIDMPKYRFEIVDAGALDISMNISGYTEEVARNFSKIANELSKETDPQAQEIKSMQMLAALTTLAINNLNISVEDNSLLNKVLDLQAAQLNQEREQLAQFVGPMASVALAPFNVPDFAASVTQALNVFMQGNKTITVSAEPENGLVVTEIIALTSGVQAGSITPAEVIERLDLQVSSE